MDLPESGYIEINDGDAFIRGHMVGGEGEFSGTFSARVVDAVEAIHLADGAVSPHTSLVINYEKMRELTLTNEGVDISTMGARAVLSPVIYAPNVNRPTQGNRITTQMYHRGNEGDSGALYLYRNAGELVATFKGNQARFAFGVTARGNFVSYVDVNGKPGDSYYFSKKPNGGTGTADYSLGPYIMYMRLDQAITGAGASQSYLFLVESILI